MSDFKTKSLSTLETINSLDEIDKVLVERNGDMVRVDSSTVKNRDLDNLDVVSAINDNDKVFIERRGSMLKVNASTVKTQDLDSLEVIESLGENDSVLVERNGEMTKIGASAMKTAAPDWDENDETSNNFIQNRTHWRKNLGNLYEMNFTPLSESETPWNIEEIGKSYHVCLYNGNANEINDYQNVFPTGTLADINTETTTSVVKVNGQEYILTNTYFVNQSNDKCFYCYDDNIIIGFYEYPDGLLKIVVYTNFTDVGSVSFQIPLANNMYEYHKLNDSYLNGSLIKPGYGYCSEIFNGSPNHIGAEIHITGNSGATTYDFTHGGRLPAIYMSIIDKIILSNYPDIKITEFNFTNSEPDSYGSITCSGTITFSSTIDSSSNLSDYSVLLSIPNKIAFGNCSHVEGYGTIAFYDYSHAEGCGTEAGGNSSHAEGQSTMALGNDSHSEGYWTEASGYASHSEGDHTIASGYCSHAEGLNTFATGYESHSEGYYTTASENYSHAEGSHTKATGTNSHAEGSYSDAGGDCSHSEGYQTRASGSSSHAEGINTRSLGYASHAEGEYTEASGKNSHAEGYNTKSSGLSSHAEGGGTDSNTGIYNYIYLSGEANATTYTVESYSAINKIVPKSLIGCEVGGYNVISETVENNIVTSIVLDFTLNASSPISNKKYMLKIYTTASGCSSHTEGIYTTASGYYSHAGGVGTIAKAYGSYSEGISTVSSGEASHAEGIDSIASGDYSYSSGEYTVSQRKSQHVFGKFNELDSTGVDTTDYGTYVEIVGNGTAKDARSNARTLDWQGNESLAGGLTLGKGTADEVTITAAQLKQLLALLS